MTDLFFLVSILVYLWLSIKVENWITIYHLGFKTETPLLFLKNQRIYDVIRIVLFITSLILTFYTNIIPWIICLFFLLIVWVLSGKIGRNKAFNKYREILKDLAEHEEDEKQKSEYLIESKISNDVLQDRATQSIKFGL
ncbi:MAG: hypothetical protein D8M26_00715 [Ignavibacteriae bacterium]|nr:hypothetical protein [Ignavibacteriota bacterium]